ncbi:MAG TPA: ParB/RepB/Spo0J family partition protein [Armatimonadota bacterium]|nr:ParB/RepB/Spo0J family partition protein [Armatimonadota bacterium]
MAERKALGRGLSSLISAPIETPGDRVLQIPIEEIRPNPRQPRQEWDEAALSDLSDSIKANGILQPVIVRGRAGSYELVAGERRLRAARQAGLTDIPAVIREIDDEGSLRLALIENIQREDITAVESARAFQSLVDRFGMSQDDVARAVGKSRPAVANTLRLLRLPDPILESLRSREITEGHARALLAVEAPEERDRLWKLAREGASVREIEAGGRKQPPSSAVTVPSRRERRAQPHLDDLASRLRRALGTKVEIRGDDNAGAIILEYYSSEDLENIAAKLLETG